MNDEILQLVRQKGLLLEKEIFDFLNNFNSATEAKDFLEVLEKSSGQKIITKAILNKKVENVQSIFRMLPNEKKIITEKFFVNLGITFEITKERTIIQEKPKQNNITYQIFYAPTKPDKKLEVSDFTGNFRARYQQLQRMLMQRSDLTNLVSINKIAGDRQSLSIIGIVVEKRMTKNKNLIIKVEDLTGEINVLVKEDKQELYLKAREVQLDDVIAIKGSGSREMLFVYDIYHPDSILTEKHHFDNDVNIAFISDIHCGSDRHLGQSFERFLTWINSDDENAKKIKYLFCVGDNVDGVGIFPGQENVLTLKSMKEQYELLASYMRRVPKDITIFMCPGQHDAIRVAEPQPPIDKRYAPQLYDIENLILVTNPTMVKLIEGTKEFKVFMYHGASIHTFINEVASLREMKAHKCPAQAVRHMLKRRHVAPTHSSVVYIPNVDVDPLVINEVPDIFCTGEVHRLDVENYNGTLILTGSCWQAQTPFEEKVGNIPDPGKVAVYNLKNRNLKIFDFGVEEEINRER